MALATERHVHVRAANERGAALGRGSKREAGVLLAKLAYGRQLLDLLALRDQREDLDILTRAKGSSDLSAQIATVQQQRLADKLEAQVGFECSSCLLVLCAVCIVLN